MRLKYSSKGNDLKREIANEIGGIIERIIEEYKEEDMVYLAKLILDLKEVSTKKEKIVKKDKSMNKVVKQKDKSEKQTKRLSHRKLQAELYTAGLETESFDFGYNSFKDGYALLMCQLRDSINTDNRFSVWINYVEKKILVSRNKPFFDWIVKKYYDDRGYELSFVDDIAWYV